MLGLCNFSMFCCAVFCVISSFEMFFIKHLLYRMTVVCANLYASSYFFNIVNTLQTIFTVGNDWPCWNGDYFETMLNVFDVELPR